MTSSPSFMSSKKKGTELTHLEHDEWLNATAKHYEDAQLSEAKFTVGVDGA